MAQKVAQNREYRARNRVKIARYWAEYRLKRSSAYREYRKKYDALYLIKNKEKLKEYRINNRERKNELGRIAYAKNPEKFREQNRLNRLANLDRRRETARICSRKNRKLFPERHALYAKRAFEKAMRNPSHYLARMLRKSLNQLFRGKAKTGKALDLLGCSIADFRIHIEKQFSNGATWDNRGKWELDHIRPCASFDLQDINQLKQCFHYTNFQPLWKSENCSKGAKWNGKDYQNYRRIKMPETIKPYLGT